MVKYIVIFLSVIVSAQTPNWVFRYNGPGSENDNATCLCYGPDSTIYAAGYCVGIDTFRDAIVASLTLAGDTNWIYRNSSNYDDIMNDIVLGPDNNLYAVGQTYSNAADGWDMFILPLEPDGSYQWYTYIGGPGYDVAEAVVCGTDSTIYIAGTLAATQEFTVISLTNGGDFNWIFTYNGPGNGYDDAASIVCGADGNIYAAGQSGGVATNADLTVISLTPAGDTNWVYRYNGPANDDDIASSIICGPDSNLYVCGLSTSSTQTDLTVISLTPSGQELWVYRYNGPLNTDDGAAAICYDSDGNLYITGQIDLIGTNSDLIVISLDPLGNERWVYSYDGPGTFWNWGKSIVYGADGNIYVAGATSGSSTYMDFTVISLTTAGDTNWLYTYNALGNSGDFANRVVYGLDGVIYAAGKSEGSGTYDDFIVISLNPTGIEERKKTGLKQGAGIMVIPNPFRSRTTLSLQGRGKSGVLNIFDITGRLVKTFDHIAGDGASVVTINWSGMNNTGRPLPSGIYFAILSTSDATYTARLVLAR